MNEEFLDGLALLMQNEDEWAKFTLMLAARFKKMKEKDNEVRSEKG